MFSSTRGPINNVSCMRSHFLYVYCNILNELRYSLSHCFGIKDEYTPSRKAVGLMIHIYWQFVNISQNVKLLLNYNKYCISKLAVKMCIVIATASIMHAGCGLETRNHYTTLQLAFQTKNGIFMQVSSLQVFSG